MHIFLKMEFEHNHDNVLRERLYLKQHGIVLVNDDSTMISWPSSGASTVTTQSGSLIPSADDSDDGEGEGDGDALLIGIESFHVVENSVPRSRDSIHKKISWLRSQIIGQNLDFDTPFGKRRLTYADHTASARSLHYIENYITANFLPLYGNSHTSDSYVGSQTTKMVHEAASYVKKCLGGGEEEAIMFCGWGSTAAIKKLQEVMGITVPSIMRERMLKCLSDEERWVVFIGPYEHHSNILSWRQSLAEVVEIGLNDDGLIDMKALRTILEFYKSKNRPILGSFSACSNVTGICSDTKAIASLVHQFGGFACFDFAASGPHEKIDMRCGEIDGYDAIFLSTHKYMGGPGTPGILLMNKALYCLGTSAPSTCGGGTVNYVNAYNEKDTLYAKSIEEREDAGTPPIIQKIRAALAFWINEYVGHQYIERQEQSYIGRALERLVSNPNVCVLGNTSAKRQAILSFLIYSTTNNSSETIIKGKEKELGLHLWGETGNTRDKVLHGPFVAKLLNDLFGIQARGGCACAGPYGHSLLNVDQTHSLALRSAIEKGYVGIKPGWTRVSFPYYMCEEEFEFIVAAIEFIAIYGQRFLGLYHFNWRSGAWTFKKSKYLNLENGVNYVEGGNISRDGDGDCDGDVIFKYTNYLETAKRIANLLPKFPPHRKIPEEIDIDLVTFRV